MVSRRELDMARNKKLLKDAATELFAENGYHATKIDDIVDIAGFSKGTFYNYFKSKEAVLLEIIDENTEKLLTDLSILCESGLSFEDAVLKMAKVKYEFSESNINFFRMVIVSAIRRGQCIPVSVKERIHAFFGDMMEIMENLFEGCAEEYRDDITALEAATIFMALTDIYVRRKGLHGRMAIISPEKIASIIIKGIGKNEEK